MMKEFFFSSSNRSFLFPYSRHILQIDKTRKMKIRDKVNVEEQLVKPCDEKNKQEVQCGKTYVFHRHNGVPEGAKKNKCDLQQHLDENVKQVIKNDNIIEKYVSKQHFTSIEKNIISPDKLPRVHTTAIQNGCTNEESAVKQESIEYGFSVSCQQTVVSTPLSPNRTMEIATVMHAGTPTSDDDTGSVRGRLESLRFYLEDKLGTDKCVSALNCLEETAESDKLVKLMNDRIGSSHMRYFPVLLQMWDLENRCH